MISSGIYIDYNKEFNEKHRKDADYVFKDIEEIESYCLELAKWNQDCIVEAYLDHKAFEEWLQSRGTDPKDIISFQYYTAYGMVVVKKMEKYMHSPLWKAVNG